MVKPKIVKSVKGEWKPLPLDPSVFSAADLDGLLGIEELTSYPSKDIKTTKKSKKNVSNDDILSNIKKSNKKKAKTKKKPQKKSFVGNQSLCPETVAEPLPEEESADVEDDVEDKSESDDLISHMAAWNGLGVPSILLRALADKSFTSPTQIQALTLPAAIFGRRDILGAAQTGSGKTLAFGLPILNAIICLSESEKRNHEAQEEDSDIEQTVESEEDNEIERTVESEEDSEKDDEEIDEAYQNDENGSNDSDSFEEIDSGSDAEGNISDDFDNFGGTAQCVKVIDNVDCDFPTGMPKARSTYTPRPLYALVLTPTRELAVQVAQHLKAAAKYTSISVSVVVGGLASQKQERLLNRGPEIVVATPGRLWDLIEDGHPHLRQVDTLRFLAIDETDRMLEKGHFEELQKLLSKINENEESRKKRQNFVFSATLTMTHEPPRYAGVKKGKKKGKEPSRLTPAQKLASIMKTVGLTNPKIVDVTEASGVARRLSEAQIICSLDEKDHYLYYFLQRHPGRTLVFCNSIEAVRRLAQLFTLLGCSPWPIHAKMNQKHRLKNLERFSASPTGVLLATDVAARGLDIPNVQHVIHYQIPRTAEGYVHRSGRTARAQQEGLTVIFTEPSEVSLFVRLFRTLGRDSTLPIFPVESQWMATVKKRVALARRLDEVELRARRITAEHGWLDKAVQEMDLEVSEDELPTSYSREGGNQFKKQAAMLRKELTKLLSKPLFPRGFSSKYPTQTGQLVVPLFPGSLPKMEDGKETAVEALKHSIEEGKAAKRKLNRERSKKSKKNKRVKMSNVPDATSPQSDEEDVDLEG